jgi:type I pantothenate kinase
MTHLTFELAVEGIAERVPAAPIGEAVCVAVAGPVAAGKTRLANGLAAALSARRPGERIAVLSTDGFLLSNADLARRGLSGCKGYPETYDVERLHATVADLRAGRMVTTPVYSHEHYDVVLGEEQAVGPCDVVVVEGLHVLAQLEGLVDYGIFVDADVELLEDWYIARFHRFRVEARDEPSSFYASMASMDDADAEALARQVWRTINLPNCVEHILATRDRADAVVVKGAEHRVVHVDLRDVTLR